ncbi:MAG: putative DNA-binding domain-containing protein [Myxococcales bacterium]|nr:putative DNA-binding domain-containing protein [Myxococcales bacterium]
MTLNEIQRAIDEALRGVVPIDEAARQLGADAGRLVIYKRFFEAHVAEALAVNLPVTQATLGDAWPGLFDAYLHRHPPTSWALNEAAAAFPGFLEAEERAGRDGVTPLHTCLAQFEWALFVATADAQAMPDPADLTRPAVNPTLSILSFPYALADFVLAWRGGARPAPPEPLAEPMPVLFYQNPHTGMGRFQKPSDEVLLALKIADEGLSVGAVAEAIGVPVAVVEAAVAAAARLGVIIAPAR